MWYWLEPSSGAWIEAEESAKIEKEYQDEINKRRPGLRVYHCFGNGWSAHIDFKTMTTSCGSGRCLLSHARTNLDDDHMTYQLKRIDHSINKMWYWLEPVSGAWIEARESENIEKEYQDEINKRRSGQLVYHCFGNGWTACIDFETMTTYCGSGRCILTHKRNNLDDDHMTFQLKRVCVAPVSDTC